MKLSSDASHFISFEEEKILPLIDFVSIFCRLEAAAAAGGGNDGDKHRNRSWTIPIMKMTFRPN